MKTHQAIRLSKIVAGYAWTDTDGVEHRYVNDDFPLEVSVSTIYEMAELAVKPPRKGRVESAVVALKGDLEMIQGSTLEFIGLPHTRSRMSSMSISPSGATDDATGAAGCPVRLSFRNRPGQDGRLNPAWHFDVGLRDVLFLDLVSAVRERRVAALGLSMLIKNVLVVQSTQRETGEQIVADDQSASWPLGDFPRQFEGDRRFLPVDVRLGDLQPLNAVGTVTGIRLESPRHALKQLSSW